MISEKPKSAMGDNEDTVDVGELSADEFEDTAERRRLGVRAAIERAEKRARGDKGGCKDSVSSVSILTQWEHWVEQELGCGETEQMRKDGQTSSKFTPNAYGT